MSRFAQHTRLTAKPGETDALVGKFMEVAEIQRDNPACELMIVSRSPTDTEVVYLTEIWTSEAEWENARQSQQVTAWAKDMPNLVAEAPESVRLDLVGGKGVSTT